MSARPDLVETGARGVVAAVRWGGVGVGTVCRCWDF